MSHLGRVMEFTRASVAHTAKKTSCSQVSRAHGGSLNLIKDLTMCWPQTEVGRHPPTEEKSWSNMLEKGGKEENGPNGGEGKPALLNQPGPADRFWGPSLSSRQTTSQHYRTPLFHLPQNKSCSFLLSDASQAAAEQTRTMWQLQTQSTNIQGVSLPHKFPPNSSTSASPNVLIHTSQTTTKPFNQKISLHHSSQEVMHLWGAPWFVVWHPDSVSRLHIFRCGRQSPIWCPWFRNSCSILFLSVPSPWHRELHRNLARCETVFHKHPKTFVIVENWNQLYKRPRRQCSCSFGVFPLKRHMVFWAAVWSSSCRRDPGESVDLLSSKPGLLLHRETAKVENREQHCPLLLVRPPAEV